MMTLSVPQKWSILLVIMLHVLGMEDVFWTFSSSSYSHRYLLLADAAIVIPPGTTLDPNEIQSETAGRVSSYLQAFPVTDPIVLRVDVWTNELVDRATSSDDGVGIPVEQTRINFVMNGLRGITDLWSDVLFDPVSSTSDLSLFVAAMLGALGPGNPYGFDPYPGFLESRQEALSLEQADEQALARDFSAEIITNYQAAAVEYTNNNNSMLMQLLPFDAAPLYQVTYGYVNATNAKTTGLLSLPGSSRCNIILNLGANRMLEQSYFSIATMHETWHCFQSFVDIDPSEVSLLFRSMREGVVTYLTSIMHNDDNATEADLLFWTPEELMAAQERQDDIINAFVAVQDTTDATQFREWLVAGIPLSSVSGAPARCGYYVAWLAVRAYVEDQLDIVSPFSSSSSSSILIELGDGTTTTTTMTLAKHLLDQGDSTEGQQAMLNALLQTRTTSKPSFPSVNTPPPTPTPPPTTTSSPPSSCARSSYYHRQNVAGSIHGVLSVQWMVSGSGIIVMASWLLLLL